MAKHRWSVRVKGSKSENIKHFKWITHMYSWILARDFFKDKTLVIYRNRDLSDDYTPIIELTYATIVARKELGLKESEERKEIMRIGRTLKEGE